MHKNKLKLLIRKYKKWPSISTIIVKIYKIIRVVSGLSKLMSVASSKDKDKSIDRSKYKCKNINKYIKTNQIKYQNKQIM